MESPASLPSRTMNALVATKDFTPEDEAHLREALKRCSPSTFEAACQFRQTGNVEHVPVIIFGVIERYVESKLRPKLKEPAAGLRLAEDLGIDSLTMMEIVMLAEDALQITINNEELHHLRTLDEVRQFMEAKLTGVPFVPEARCLAS
jgi:3-hydroxyacyl-[acyl-carrier-protein] dehydratase